jgi:hypothetical protein
VLVVLPVELLEVDEPPVWIETLYEFVTSTAEPVKGSAPAWIDWTYWELLTP